MEGASKKSIQEISNLNMNMNKALSFSVKLLLKKKNDHFLKKNANDHQMVAVVEGENPQCGLTCFII